MTCVLHTARISSVENAMCGDKQRKISGVKKFFLHRVDLINSVSVRFYLNLINSALNKVCMYIRKCFAR